MHPAGCKIVADLQNMQINAYFLPELLPDKAQNIRLEVFDLTFVVKTISSANFVDDNKLFHYNEISNNLFHEFMVK